MLLKHYDRLGGLSTGGLVIWINQMTDWERLAQLIRGIASDLLDRLPRKDAVAGPQRELCGAVADAATAAYWQRAHHHLYNGIVTSVADGRSGAFEAGQSGTGAGKRHHFLLHGIGAPLRSCEDGA